MKTEMKKNNKMFLALAVIAALAMVSVAGVALNSEESEAIIIEPTNVTVEAGETYTDNFSIMNGGKLTVLGTYTGTVKFYSGAEVDANALVTVIEFTGVTNAIIANTEGNVTIWTYNSSTVVKEKRNVTDGTITVTQGKVTLGLVADATKEKPSTTGYFTGTVSGKTMTLTSVNTVGAVIVAGSTDALSGVITQGEQTYDKMKLDGTLDSAEAKLAGKLTVSGTGVYKGATTITSTDATDFVTLVIADGATLSSYGTATAGDIEITVVGTPTYGKLLNADGTLAKDGTLAAGKVTFAGVNVTNAYYVAIVNADGSVYFAKVTFTVSGATVTPKYTVATKAGVIASAATELVSTGKLKAGITPTATTNTVFYDSATDKVLYSTATTDAAGTLTFAAAALSAVTNVKVLFINKDTGAAHFYNGNLTSGAAANDPNTLVASDSVGSIGATKITATAGTDTLNIGANSVLTVEGTLIAGESSAVVKAVITLTGKCNAAYYQTETGVSPKFITNYYTTFNKALAASDDIKVLGTIAFLEDQTWETGKTGATETKITFESGAGEATVGSTYIKGVSEDVFVTITVPKATTVTITPVDALKVVNGKISFSELSEAPAAADAGIDSAVGMKEGTSYVYTDLATALSTAVADDTIELRRAATISKDAEIKADVKVIGNSQSLTVAAGATFTVSGDLTGLGGLTVKAASTTKTAGTLTVNNMFETAGTFQMDGIFNITDKVGTSTKSVALPAVAIVTDGEEDSPAVINIAGIVSNANPIGKAGKFMTINVTGKLATGVNGSFLGNITMNVTGGEFSYAAAANSIDELNVTGNGIVKKAAGALTVNKKAVIGTPANEIAAVANGAAVEFALGDNAFVTVYGTTAAGKIAITGLDSKATLFMDTSILYATVHAGTANASIPVDTPEITGMKFMGYYNNPAFIVTGEIYVNEVPSTAAGTKYYMKLDVATTSITVNAPVGSVVKINGAEYNGIVDVPYDGAGYVITVETERGYSGDNAKILVNGEPVTGAVELKAGDVITVEGIEEGSEQGSGIIVYLLAAITVIIAVIAVVVAVKLLRS